MSLDQFLLNGVPVINDIHLISSMISPSMIADKISEKLIGKVKEYECNTLVNYLDGTQSSNDLFNKYVNDYSDINNQLLFDFIDNLELTLDK